MYEERDVVATFPSGIPRGRAFPPVDMAFLTTPHIPVSFSLLFSLHTILPSAWYPRVPLCTASARGGVSLQASSAASCHTSLSPSVLSGVLFDLLPSVLSGVLLYLALRVSSVASRLKRPQWRLVIPSLFRVSSVASRPKRPQWRLVILVSFQASSAASCYTKDVL